MALSSKYYILNPFHSILHRFQRQWIALRYFKAFHRRLQTRRPRLFHDKVLWLMNNTPQERQSRLADKYAVRGFIEEQGCGQLLASLYGKYDTAAEIDFDKLPKQFVLKTNNGCTTNVVVTDKAAIDTEAVRRQMGKWLKIRFGDLTGERQYSLMKPCIIAEELLVESKPGAPLTDYKFDCFDGRPMYCSVYNNRVEGTHRKSSRVYDMDFHPVEDALAYSLPWITPGEILPKPSCWDQMKEIARKLSKGFAYVRVDLYVIDGKPRFSELSFTPGFDMDYTSAHSRRMGDLIHLPTDN